MGHLTRIMIIAAAIAFHSAAFASDKVAMSSTNITAFDLDQIVALSKGFFAKGGHWGIFRRCFERGAAHFHLLCCADRYMSYFAVSFSQI